MNIDNHGSAPENGASLAGGSRVEALDILRGVAVMGILAMNAPGFAFPEPAYFNPTAYGGARGADLLSWLVNFIFFDGKMRGLFSLLFGASLLLIVDGADRKGESAAGVHYRRMIWLAVFGAIHFYLIWWGDILLHYALIGLVAYFFVRLDLKMLGFFIVMLLAADLALMLNASGNYIQLSRAAAAPGAERSVVEAWDWSRQNFGPMSAERLAHDLQLHRGYWTDLVRERWQTQATLPFQYLTFGGPETLALMLIGMAGVRTGFLTGAWSARTYRKVAFWCLAVGALGFAFLAYVMMEARFEPGIVFAASFGATPPFRLVMVIGYAALIILLARRGGALVRRIAAAGRAAFSNYLGTSLIMTGLFYGWGLGLYGQVGRAALWPIVFAIWALMLLWSEPWLRRFRYGPLEWLWRSLARGRAQSMRLPTAQIRPNS